MQSLLEPVRLLTSSASAYASRLARDASDVRAAQALRFKSSLLEPATRPVLRSGTAEGGPPHALSAGFIEYGLSDGDVAEEVCYWKDMTLLPHLLNLFSKRGLTARLRFTELRQARGDRKQLARCEVSYAHGDSPVTGSTFGREMVYSVAHAIHHYALISIMARLMDAKLPEHFGVAPSTVAHQKGNGEKFICRRRREEAHFLTNQEIGAS